MSPLRSNFLTIYYQSFNFTHPVWHLQPSCSLSFPNFALSSALHPPTLLRSYFIAWRVSTEITGWVYWLDLATLVPAKFPLTSKGLWPKKEGIKGTVVKSIAPFLLCKAENIHHWLNSTKVATGLKMHYLQHQDVNKINGIVWLTNSEVIQKPFIQYGTLIWAKTGYTVMCKCNGYC